MITERLVDVVDTSKMAVVHTFPIAIDAGDAVPHDAEFEQKASAAAAIALPVPDAELGKLATQMHVDRGGPLQPYGDEHGSLVMTRDSIEQETRERAYHAWLAEGCPDGRAEAHWHAAQHRFRCERAYRLWQLEGRPEERSGEHWHRALQFE